MNILAAANTKNIFHKGKNGNIYQLDSILNQLNIEKKLEDDGWNINYVHSNDKEKEAENLVSLVHKKDYLDVFRQSDSDTKYLTTWVCT